MFILFNCPECNKEYLLPQKQAGKKAKCVCNHILQVPESNDALKKDPISFESLPETLFILGNSSDSEKHEIHGFLDRDKVRYYCFWTHKKLVKEFLVQSQDTQETILEIPKEHIKEILKVLPPQVSTHFIYNPNLYTDKAGSPGFSVSDFPKEKMLSFDNYRDYWSYVKSYVSDYTHDDEVLQSRFKADVWSLHQNMSISELVSYLANLMENQKISLFNDSSEFEFIWLYIVKTLQLEGVNLDDEVISYVKNLIKCQEEMTFCEAIKNFNAFYELGTALVILGDQVCPKCGESNWSLLELSPNRISAKFQCSFCEKIILAKKSDSDNNTQNSNGRYIPKEVQREVWRRDGGRCVECGIKENIEFDHIIPLSKGGSNTVRNIQLLCQECNNKKSNNDPGSY